MKNLIFQMLIYLKDKSNLITLDYKKVKLHLTDLAQSESSLAGANANLIKAETELLHQKLILRELQERCTAKILIRMKKYVIIDLPDKFKRCFNIAKFNNLNLLISKLSYQIAKKI